MILQVSNLYFGYSSSKIILREINFNIEKLNQWTYIHGPNGAGKTTLLRLLVGLLKPVSGRVQWNADLTLYYAPATDRFVPQRLSVQAALKYVLRLYAKKRNFSRLAENIFWNGVERYGLQDSMGKLVGQLSTGQRRKLHFILCDLIRPKVVIFDELFSSIAEEDTIKFVDSLKQREVLLIFSGTAASSPFCVKEVAL